MTVRSKANDLKYGLAQEDGVLKILQHNWKEEINIQNTKVRYNNEMHKFDFESDSGTKWELKSRRNTKTKYSTTIIPMHKLIQTDNTFYFVFNFTDKCCYIQYDPDVFKTFKTTMLRCFRQGDHYNPIPHYEIPITLLKDLEVPNCDQ